MPGKEKSGIFKPLIQSYIWASYDWIYFLATWGNEVTEKDQTILELEIYLEICLLLSLFFISFFFERYLTDKKKRIQLGVNVGIVLDVPYSQLRLRWCPLAPGEHADIQIQLDIVWYILAWLLTLFWVRMIEVKTVKGIWNNLMSTNAKIIHLKFKMNFSQLVPPQMGLDSHHMSL